MGEETLALQLRASAIPFAREHRFHAERNWRFDFALPCKIAVEVEGLVGNGKSRHQTIGGYKKDLEKYAAAAELGWQVLRFSADQVRAGAALGTIERVLRVACSAPKDGPSPAGPTEAGITKESIMAAKKPVAVAKKAPAKKPATKPATKAKAKSK